MNELPNYEAAFTNNELYYKAYQTKFYMDRVLKNLNNIKNYPNVKRITVINPNLYELAAKYYNNSDQWTVIAEANGFDTPFLDGVFDISIPDNPSSSSGGVLNV